MTARTFVRNAVIAALALLAFAIPARNRLTDLGTATPTELVAGMALILMALFNVALLRQHGRLLLRVRALEAHSNATDRPATVSTSAPQLQLERLGGGLATIGAFPVGNHQKVLLIFTDPGCGPCQVLAPELVEWQSRAGDDLAIVPVARADANTARNAYPSLGLDHVLLDPSGQAGKAYGADGFPTAILITADGRIARPPVLGVDAIIGLLTSLVRNRYTSDHPDGSHEAPQMPVVAPA